MGQKGTVSGADQESIQVSDKQAPEPGSNTPDETGIPIDSKDLRAQQKRLPNQPRHEPDDQGVRCLLDHHTRPYPPHQKNCEGGLLFNSEAVLLLCALPVTGLIRDPDV